MELWMVWIVIALVAILIEIFTVGFAVICFAVGGFVTALVAYLGMESILWQLAIFSLVTALSLAFVRPLMLRLLRRERDDSKPVTTNLSALVGRRAVVTEAIRGGVGRVSVDGDDWKAEMDGEDGSIEVGERVEVVRVESVVLIVKTIK